MDVVSLVLRSATGSKREISLMREAHVARSEAAALRRGGERGRRLRKRAVQQVQACQVPQHRMHVAAAGDNGMYQRT